MTKNEIIDILNQIESGLLTNKTLVTEKILDEIEKFWSVFNTTENNKLVATVLDIDANKANILFNSISEGLKYERKLIVTDLTDKLIATINRLKSRPIVLGVIAALT